MDKVHEPKDLDVSGAARGVWLVKVPKYLAEKWNKAGPSADVGKLKISKAKVPGGKPEVIFSLNESLAAVGAGETTPVPREHKFVLTGIATQSLNVLSSQPDFDKVPLDTEYPPEKVAVEGKVIQRAECRPLGDSSYMKLKKVQYDAVQKPQKQIVQLDRVVQNYKPKSYHVHDMPSSRDKDEKAKRARMDPDKVQEMLFAAFEKHQYYNVKDLVRITQQPITYLKEILKEICIYNMKAPHRNMWELKPEYRHYKSADKDDT